MKLLLPVLALVLFSGCSLKSQRNEDHHALLRSNEQQRRAHLLGDAGMLTAAIADTMMTLSRGSIEYASNAQIKERFEAYFKQVTYLSWDDTRPPVITLSEDGTLASMYVQKFLDVWRGSPGDTTATRGYSLFAWHAEYQKVGGQWKITANTSNQTALNEEEALQVRIGHSIPYAVLDEKDLIPEGTAYDPVTGTLYISSTYKQKIVAVDADGNARDFTTEQQDGLWSTVGMAADHSRRMLWVVSFNGHEVLPMKYPEPETEWSSRIYAYPLDETAAPRIFDPELEMPHGFNDLCVDSEGSVYITESVNNKIYHLDPEKGIFTPLPIEEPQLEFPNGITISDDNRFLYIASRNGILQYDLLNKAHRFLAKLPGINDTRLDGLAWYRGSLVANQPFRNRILQFELDEENGRIVSQRILEASHPYFDQPSTGAVAGDMYIFLANAQMQSGFTDGAIKPLSELDSVRLLSLSFPELFVEE